MRVSGGKTTALLAGAAAWGGRRAQPPYPHDGRHSSHATPSTHSQRPTDSSHSIVDDVRVDDSLDVGEAECGGDLAVRRSAQYILLVRVAEDGHAAEGV